MNPVMDVSEKLLVIGHKFFPLKNTRNKGVCAIFEKKKIANTHVFRATSSHFQGAKKVTTDD